MLLPWFLLSTSWEHLRGITVPAWAASYATIYMAGILIQAGNSFVEDLFCGRWDEVDKH